MLKWWFKQYRIWQCKRQFAGLDDRTKNLFRAMKVDPESKIKRGDFNRGAEHKIQSTNWDNKGPEDILKDMSSAIKSIREGSRGKNAKSNL